MGRTRGRIIALAAVALMSVTAMPAHADTEVDSSSSTAARESATVTVPVRTMSGLRAIGGHSGSILIRIGRSAPIRVALDTGFTGLVLIPGAWQGVPSGVELAKKQTSTRLSDGTAVKGFAGKGKISINGVHGVVPVPFLYTTSDGNFARSLASTGVSGLMGIGLKGSNTMTNVLQSLPGELGLRWSLHYDMPASGSSSERGALVLGAESPTNPTMAFQMPPNGVDANGAKLWNDQAIPACWTFGRLPEMCLPTLFDSEFTVFRATGISGRGISTDARGNLRTGTRVGLAAPGSAYIGWSYLAGQRPSVNRTQILKHGKPSVIVGNMVFFDFTISYNAATGRLSLSDPTRKAAS